MIVYLQFPLADIRLFLERETKKLPLPLWPSPTPYKEFVRSFGPVKVREKGGVRGWVGENEICNANRAFSFSSPCNYYNSRTKKNINFRCSARHFYFDGLAVGKFEIIFVSRPISLNLSFQAFSNILNNILHSAIIISIPNEEDIEKELIKASRPLEKMYQLASSYTNSYSLIKEQRWVISGSNALVVEFGASEEIKISDVFEFIPIPKKYNIQLYHCWFRIDTVPVRLWLIKRLPGAKSQFVHVLRLFLMRLNAEHECVKIVLAKIDSGEIPFNENTMASHFIQHYLNDATRKISRMDTKNEVRWETDRIGELARSSLDISNPGQLDSLLGKIKIANIRPQVFRKVENLVKQIYIEEQIMGDKYNVGQAGAVGPNSHAHDMNFNQIWMQLDEEYDLEKLADELSILRLAMKEKSTQPDHDIAIGEVSYAENAAREGDGPKSLEHLKKAGSWAFDIATKIGVTVAATALKLSLGLS